MKRCVVWKPVECYMIQISAAATNTTAKKCLSVYLALNIDPSTSISVQFILSEILFRCRV